MERRDFFRTLAIGAAVVPAAAFAAKVVVRPGMRVIPIDLPQNDKITSMLIHRDHLFIACASSIYTVPLSELPK